MNICFSCYFVLLHIYLVDQQLPNGDVFSSLIWCTVDVNASGTKFFFFFPALYFCPSISGKLLLYFLFLCDMQGESSTD